MKKAINLLLKEEIEQQLLNESSFTDKHKMMAFLTYMLSGVVFNFTEQEFYFNVVVLLENLYKLLCKILIKDVEQVEKKKGFSGCKAQPSDEECTGKRFYK